MESCIRLVVRERENKKRLLPHQKKKKKDPYKYTHTQGVKDPCRQSMHNMPYTFYPKVNNFL